MKFERLSALIVDDDEVVRKMLSFALGRVGFSCLCATDGADAFATLDSGTFDLVITDLAMPKTNGYALASTLLECRERPFIVVHTAVLEPKLTKDLERRGVDEIVFKPTDYNAFAERMRILVGERKERKAETAQEILELEIKRVNNPAWTS
ncbi:response regulator [Pirellulaceae bacterium SH467]|jgi:DNA-binding response OmpR family regulator